MEKLDKDTIEYLKGHAENLRDEAENVDEEEEDREDVIHELELKATAIEVAIKISTIGITCAFGEDILEGYRDALESEIESIFDQYGDLSRREKIEDRGATMEMAYQVREALILLKEWDGQPVYLCIEDEGADTKQCMDSVEAILVLKGLVENNAMDARTIEAIEQAISDMDEMISGMDEMIQDNLGTMGEYWNYNEDEDKEGEYKRMAQYAGITIYPDGTPIE